jgi:hypothetical protein
MKLLEHRRANPEEPAEDEVLEIAAWQHLIDTGVVWNLGGYFERGASDMIAYGFCRAREDRGKH